MRVFRRARTYNQRHHNEKDNKKLLESTDDLAAAMWKGKWRMPTIEEFKELLSKCKSRWTTMDGIKGRLFTGPNGNSIFLPAAGKCEEGHSGFPSGQDKFGAYWSSSLNPSLSDMAQYLYFDSKQVSEARNFRYRGMSVRPVME